MLHPLFTLILFTTLPTIFKLINQRGLVKRQLMTGKAPAHETPLNNSENNGHRPTKSKHLKMTDQHSNH